MPDPSPDSVERIQDRIFSIRGRQVILDSELAALYPVETGALNRAVARNKDRFPDGFCFRLTNHEWDDLRCQSGISSSEAHGDRRRTP